MTTANQHPQRRPHTPSRYDDRAREREGQRRCRCQRQRQQHQRQHANAGWDDDGGGDDDAHGTGLLRCEHWLAGWIGCSWGTSPAYTLRPLRHNDRNGGSGSGHNERTTTTTTPAQNSDRRRTTRPQPHEQLLVGWNVGGTTTATANGVRDEGHSTHSTPASNCS
jgi:hypothetical protein